MSTDHVIKISKPEVSNGHTIIRGEVKWKGDSGEPCFFRTTETVLRSDPLGRLPKNTQYLMVCCTEDYLTARLLQYYRRCQTQPSHYGKPEST